MNGKCTFLIIFKMFKKLKKQRLKLFQKQNKSKNINSQIIKCAKVKSDVSKEEVYNEKTDMYI